jgi:hypothetical protein
VRALALLALLALAGCRTPAPCPEGLDLSPLSGLCAVEGSDSWYMGPKNLREWADTGYYALPR